MRKPSRFNALILSCCIFVAAFAIMGCNASSQVAPPANAAAASGGAEMALIPAGKFNMGSESGNADEQPKHEVLISSFLMDCAEVTQEQYDKFALGNPSHFKGSKLPVEQISWADAALYCNARSRAEGLTPCYDEQTAECNFAANGYRLPTEAEWEYACRAGSTADYGFGNDPRSLKDHAWHADNAAKKTHAVRQKRPNAWGLHDMHGNVAEWCNDRYSEQYYASSPPENPPGPNDGERYVLRGGAWNCRAEQCRSSSRAAEDPGFQDACFARDAIGFRCVRTTPPATGSPTQP
jgi:formylglycine-generating enzyme required for sulfatase activity